MEVKRNLAADDSCIFERKDDLLQFNHEKKLLQTSSNPNTPTDDRVSPFTFGASERMLRGQLTTPGLDLSLERSSFLSPKFHDVDNIGSFRPPPAFGRSRRMSRSLPELREVQFVSVLPDLEEEESESTEYQTEEKVLENPVQVPWYRKWDFVLCSVCQALGLGNVWRFPYYCYSNGGGTFMFAYLILFIICGAPFFCLELSIGQMTQSGPISSLAQICPLMKGIGVASMMLSFWVTAYYSVLVSWTLFFIFNSFYSPPRWIRCGNTWNSISCKELESDFTTSLDSKTENNVLSENLTAFRDIERNISFSNSSIDVKLLQNASQKFSPEDSVILNHTHPAVEFVQVKLLEIGEGIGDLKELRFELVAAVLFVWILIYFALRKKDLFQRTYIYTLTILSHLLLISFFLRMVGLDGAKTGLQYLFKPEWNKIGDARVWLYALAQAFHSLGAILGPTIVMGSCQKPHNNLMRDTTVLIVVTLFTVVMVACVAFGTLGHLAFTLDKPIEEVLERDPSCVFIMYSVIVSLMPVPSCWGVIFFLVFLCLGLDSQIKLMSTLVSALKEAYTFYIKQRFQGHSLFLAAICGVCCCATIPYLTQAGIYFFLLIDHYTAVLAVCVVALLEICTLSWLYGIGALSSALQQMTGKMPSHYYRFTWMVLSPAAIIVILGYSIFKLEADSVHPRYIYPQWAHITGWIVFALTLCWVPFLAVAAYRKAPKSHIFSRLAFAAQAKIGSVATWDPKPVLIFNESTLNDSDLSDYKFVEQPSSVNSVQSSGRYSGIRQNNETPF